MTKSKYRLIRSETEEGETIIFCKDTEILTEVPTEVIRRAARFVTNLTVKYVPQAQVTISTDGKYEVGISKWWEDWKEEPEIRVVLRKYSSQVDAPPLECWELEEATPIWLKTWKLVNPF